MNGIDEFFEQIRQADDPTEVLIIDLYQALSQPIGRELKRL